MRSSWSLLAPALAAAVLSGFLLIPAVGQDDDPPPPKKSKVGSKLSKAKKAKPAKLDDDDKPAKGDPDDEDAPKKGKGDDEKPSDDDGFGAARKPVKQAPLKKGRLARGKPERSKKTDEDGNEIDLEKLKLSRAITKKLGSKEEGFFIVQTMERAPIPPDAKPEEQKDYSARIVGGVRESVEFKLYEGRQNAVDDLVVFLSEFPKPKGTPSRSSRKAKDAGPPPPERDFRLVRVFPAGQEGGRLAEAFREQAEKDTAWQWKAAAERQKSAGS